MKEPVAVPGNLGPEKKYGQNWDKKMWMCPRCVDAVPVFFKMSERGQATLEKAQNLNFSTKRHLP